MKYKFPYETLMKHRKNLEEVKRKAYLEAKEKVKNSQENIDKTFKKREKALEDICQIKGAGGQRINEIQNLEAFALGQEALIQQEEKKLKEFIKEEQRKHGHFVEALKELKILEKLKEKKEEAFRRELIKKEYQEIEDILIMGGRSEK